MNRVTKAEIKKVRELRKAGKRAKEIAYELGVKEPRVRYILGRLTAIRTYAPKRPITNAEIARARQLLAEGLGPNAVAKEIGRRPGKPALAVCIAAGYVTKASKRPSSYALAAAYANGKTLKQINEETGADDETVRKACKKHGVQMRSTRSKVSIKSIVALLAAGKSQRAVGRIFGLSRGTIETRYRRWKKTNGTLPTPSSAGSPQPSSASPSGS